MALKVTFRCKSLGISHVCVHILDSKHVQLSMYTTLQEEFESAIKLDRLLHAGEQDEKNQPTRFSISENDVSYYISPLCMGPLRSFQGPYRVPIRSL